MPLKNAELNFKMSGIVLPMKNAKWMSIDGKLFCKNPPIPVNIFNISFHLIG